MCTITEKEYREHPAISRSSLWKIRESPEKFKYFLENPQKPTPALIFGQVFHKLALEPLTFGEEFAVAPVVDRRTALGKSKWNDFVASADGKIIIDQDTFDKASEMVCALYRAPYVKKLLSGQHEVPMFWNDDLTGEPCKCRHDAVSVVGGNDIIVDIKTTADASTEAFMRSAVKYGYDFQAAMYSDGYEKNTGKKPMFVFIAIEKDPPYAVNILQADEAFITHGYDVFRELIGIYHECKETNNWYGYLGAYKAINNLGLPSWLSKEIE